MQRKTQFAVIAGGLFLAQFTVEHLRATDPFDALTLMADLLETLLLAGAVAMTAFVSVETREIRLERLDLIDDLARARRESGRWREAARSHVAGLSQAIAAQFRGWGMTEAEADVAGLMLKGLSHKEIAALRGGSDATVRQHATAIYRKSGLTSRSQLTAYFLEDLLMPQDPPRLRVVQDRA